MTDWVIPSKEQYERIVERYDELGPEYIRAVRKYMGKPEIQKLLRRAMKERIDCGPLVTPLDVIGEQLNIVAGISGLSEGTEVRSAEGAVPLSVRGSLAVGLAGASPVLWNWEMVDAAKQIPLPRHTISPDIMPLPVMWWTFDRDMVSMQGPDGEHLNVLGFLLMELQEGIALTPIAQKSMSEFYFHSQIIKFHSTYPDDFNVSVDDGAEDLRIRTIAMLAFMASPYISSRERLQAPRAQRRRMEPGEIIPEVTVIKLRRAIHPQGESGDGNGTVYNSRWYVSGHMRAQWYPSLRAHKLIWIAPYIKGPEGAPFHSQVRMVVR